MRLIDLDDSAHTYLPWSELWSIDTEKTVEAIPIDYIKRMAEVMSDVTGGRSVDIIDLIIIAWKKRSERKEE